MKRRTRIGRAHLLWVLLLMSSAFCGSSIPPARRALAARLGAMRTWHVDHACALPPPRASSLVVHDPDAFCASPRPGGGVRLAYLSVGEIHESLPMLETLRRRGALLGENPNWPGAHYVDVLHPAHIEDYLVPRARQVAASDFDGLFLDTLDSALGPSGRVSAERAAATERAVRTLRNLFPGRLLVPNGGLSLDLDRVAPLVDAWAVEDLFGGYRWDARTYGDTPPARTAAILPKLRALRNGGLPVFVLDYVERGDARRRASIEARCRAEGFRCAVASMPFDSGR